MSIEANKAIVRRLYEEVYEKGNVAVVDELIAPEYVLRNAASGWRSSQNRGPEVYRHMVRAWRETPPVYTVTIEQMIAEGDKVVTVFTFAGTQRGDLAKGPFGPIKPTGRLLNLPDIMISRISDGKIVEEWESANWASIWQQLGAIPPPTS
jgi:predicted ester cyclase